MYIIYNVIYNILFQLHYIQNILSVTFFFLKKQKRYPHYGSADRNLIRIHEHAGSIPGLVQLVKDPVLL